VSVPVTEGGLRRKMASGAGWSFIDNLSQQVLSLIIFVILGRLLSPAVFGIVSTATVIVLLMRSAILNSITPALVAFPHPEDVDYDTAFWICVGVGSCAFVILLIAAGPLSSFFHIGELASVIRAMGAIVLLAALAYTHAAWAQRNFMFREVAMRNTISTAVAGLVGISVALAGYGLLALVLNQVVQLIVAVCLLWRAVPWHPRFRFSKTTATALMKVALPLGLNQSLWFIAQNFDTAFVTWFLGPLVGGLYAAAKRVVNAVLVAVDQPIISVALPAFAEVVSAPARFAEAVVRFAGTVTAVGAPLFAGIALTAPFSMALLFGAKWSGAAPIVVVLAGGAVAVPTLTVLQQVALALGRARTILITTVVQIALALSAIALVAQRDAVSIALCLTLPTLVTFIAMPLLLARATLFPLRKYALAVIRPLICTAIMIAVVLVIPDLNHGPLVQLVSVGLIGAIVYSGATLVIARNTINELLDMSRMLLKRRGNTKATS